MSLLRDAFSSLSGISLIVRVSFVSVVISIFFLGKLSPLREL
jgi:hypothetical protein